MKDYFNIINEEFLKDIKLDESESSFNINTIRYKHDKKLIDDIINKNEYKYLNENEINILKKFNNSMVNYNDEQNLNFLKTKINELLIISNEDLLMFSIKNQLNGLFNLGTITFNNKESLRVVQGSNNIPNPNLYKNNNFIKLYKKTIKDILSLYINDINIDNIVNEIYNIEYNLYKYRMSSEDRRNVLKNFNKYNISDIKFNNFNFQLLISKLLNNINYNSNIIYFDSKLPSEYYNLIDNYFNNSYFKYYIIWCILAKLSQVSFGKLYHIIFELMKVIKGIKKNMPLDKKIYNLNNLFVGHIISKEYYIYINPDVKPIIKKYIEYIKKSFKNRLNNNTWMDLNTKKIAIEKLDNITVDIYDSKFIDFNELNSINDIYYDNIIKINEYTYNKFMQKLVNNQEIFHGNIYNINAFYSPVLNKIIFPYGILNPPYFYYSKLNNLDVTAYNFGAIGSVIGHEIIHGFDDQGRLFDKNGNLNNWWSKESDSKYMELANKIGNIYKEKSINPKLTMGENIADIGGVRISLSAFKLLLKDNNKELDKKYINYFIKGWAMVWRGKMREEERKIRLLNDTHSPIKERVNIPLNNLKELNDTNKEVIEIW